MPDFDPYLSWLGIPPTHRPPTLYQLLGVDPAITDATIIKALAIQRTAYVRNFQRGERSELCSRILEELAAAEAVLTDSVKRAAYDKTLKPAAPPPPAPGAAPRASSARTAAPPAQRAVAPTLAKRSKRGRRDESAAALKWFGMAAGVVVLLIGLVAASKLLRGPESGTLEIAFEKTWDDAIVAIDGKPVQATTNGASLTLPPGSHAVRVTRGTLGAFDATAEVRPRESAKIRVPASAFAAPARMLVAKFLPSPADAAASASGNARLDHQPPLYALSYDNAALAAGVDVTFTKRGFKPKTVRVAPGDADRSSPIDVALEPEAPATGFVVVSPPFAEVAAPKFNVASAGAPGKWAITTTGAAGPATVEVSARGFSRGTVQVPLDGTTKRVGLIASPADSTKYYQDLGPDAALRMVGRAAAFGRGVRVMALSRNGKFLATAERGVPVRVNVWDVEGRRFVGRALDNSGVVDKAETPKGSALSIAVSNDGRFVVVSCYVLCVFDFQESREVRRIGTDVEKTVPGDVLEVAFSEDGEKLYSVLRDGRLVARDVKTWKITGTSKGLEPDSLGVRISGDGEFATGFVRRGPYLWTRSEGRSVVLESEKAVPNTGRWGGRPDLEHFSVATGPGSSNEARRPFGEDELKEGLTVGGLEVRRYDGPKTALKKLGEPDVIFKVEPLSANHTAVAVLRQRSLTTTQGPVNIRDWALRVWDVNAGKVAAEAGLPSTIYDVASSDDGRTLATVVEREHAVYVWKFNPKGVLDRRFGAVRWAAELEQWRGRSKSGESRRLSLAEVRRREWNLTEGNAVTPLKEKQFTQEAVVLEGNGVEHHFFNSGYYWTRKAVPSSERDLLVVHPDREGMEDTSGRSKRPAETWTLVGIGSWYPRGAPPRLPASADD